MWEESKDINGLKPTLAAVKEPKANIDASWNSKGNKFCVATASGNVFIGNYSESNAFWIGHPISKSQAFLITIDGKKPLHKSSVISVRFDPQSSRVVASASADGNCYITTCYVKGVDDESKAGPFGGVTSFGENLLTFNAIGWVNSVSFSPDSSVLAYASNIDLVYS